MDNLANNKSIVGKSFGHWQNIYDEGIIDSHVINLRLAHLKYAIDQKLITIEEYFICRMRITNKYKPSSTDYKPCVLMDFGKALKKHNSMGKLELNQFSKIDQYSEKKLSKTQNNVENIIQLSESIQGLNEYYSDDEKEINGQTKITTKSRKKRQKKKKIQTYTNITTKTDCTEKINEEILENSTKQIIAFKGPVKIFVRPMNKMYKNCENNKTVRKESMISTKKSVRDIFSKILKEFKKERQLQMLLK